MVYRFFFISACVILVLAAVFFAIRPIKGAFGEPTICSASPQTIVAGGSSKITWSSPGTYCVASMGWSGSFAANGSKDVSPKDSTSYILQCFNDNGTATSCSAHVFVLDAALRPTVSCSASPQKIKKGQSTTIAWNSTGASACSASGGWAGSKATSGSQIVSPDTSTAYILACPAFGLEAQCSTIVEVEELSAGPSGEVVADATITCNNGRSTAPTKSIAVPEGNYVCLSANADGGKGGSRSIGGSIVKYEWDLNSDGLFSNTSQDKSCFNSPTCPVTFTPFAPITVNLKVTDSRGLFALDSVSIGLLKSPSPPPAPALQPVAKPIIKAPTKTVKTAAKTPAALSSASIFDKAYGYDSTELICRLFK